MDSRLRGNSWCFVAPQAWEIPSIGWLEGEVFGPILHIIRMKDDDISKTLDEINSTGFGLTGGLHSRIESTVKQVESTSMLEIFTSTDPSSAQLSESSHSAAKVFPAPEPRQAGHTTCPALPSNASHRTT